MKTAKNLIMASVLLLFPVLSMQTAMAGEDSSSVTVTYTPDTVYAYVKLKVEVEGNGEVLDMNQPIRNGIVIYDMQEGDVKALEIRPDDGYVIKNVEYANGYETQNLTSHLKDNTIQIELKDLDAVLHIRFEKKASDTESQPDPEENGKPSKPDDEPNGNPSKPNGESNENTVNSNKKPNKDASKKPSKEVQMGVDTGDTTGKEWFLMLAGISFVLLLIVWKKKKDNEDERFKVKDIEERK